MFHNFWIISWEQRFEVVSRKCVRDQRCKKWHGDTWLIWVVMIWDAVHMYVHMTYNIYIYIYMHIVYHMISHYSLLYCITLCYIILYCNWTFSMMQRRLKIHVLYMNAAASELICPLTCVHIKWMEMQLKTVYIYVGAGICNPVHPASVSSV